MTQFTICTDTNATGAEVKDNHVSFSVELVADEYDPNFQFFLDAVEASKVVD